MGTGVSTGSAEGEPDAELDGYDDSGVIVPPPARSVFAWGIHASQTRHVRSELQRMNVDQLRKNYGDSTVDRTPATNSLLKGVAHGGVAGWRKADIINETLKLNG